MSSIKQSHFGENIFSFWYQCFAISSFCKKLESSFFKSFFWESEVIFAGRNVQVEINVDPRVSKTLVKHLSRFGYGHRIQNFSKFFPAWETWKLSQFHVFRCFFSIQVQWLQKWTWIGQHSHFAKKNDIVVCWDSTLRFWLKSEKSLLSFFATKRCFRTISELSANFQ